MTAGWRKIWGLLLAGTLALCSVSAHAQGTIAGTVIDSESGKPIPGANVFLEATRQGTVTNDQGQFKLRDVAPGTYTLIASMVGYERQGRTITVKKATGEVQSNLQLKLAPRVVRLQGVTVEGERGQWLRHLERFRESFFGEAPNASKCAFVNPEVLSFKERKGTLIAHAQQPLQVRNEALGYRITFHLSRYVARPNAWKRYGTAEFDTLQATSREQRRRWQRARAETYRGSLYHFLDALQSGMLTDAGFQVRVATNRQVQIRGGQVRVLGGRVISRASTIFTPARRPGLAFLSIPQARTGSTGLIVQYDSEGQFTTVESAVPSGGRFPAPASDQKVTWIQIRGGNRVLINTRTGAYVRPERARYVMKGYWGRYTTAATALPAGYQPPTSSE